jgi:hypothetical protein
LQSLDRRRGKEWVRERERGMEREIRKRVRKELDDGAYMYIYTPTNL